VQHIINEKPLTSVEVADQLDLEQDTVLNAFDAVRIKRAMLAE